MIRPFRSTAALIVAWLITATAWASDTVTLGFETETIGPLGEKVTWVVSTPGWNAELSPKAKHLGEVGALLTVQGGTKAPFGNLLRSVDPAPYRGKRIALRSMIRVSGAGRAQQWLRVDRPGNSSGAFDNMHDRPIRAGGWTTAVIEAEVDADAQNVVLGFMGFGELEISVDEVTVEILGDAVGEQAASPPRALSTQGLENVRAAAKLVSYLRFFHPTDELRQIKDWGPVAIHLIEAAEPAADSRDLAQRLSGALVGLAPGVDLWVTTDSASAAPPLRPIPEGATETIVWRHFGAGLVASAQNPLYRSVRDRPLLKSAIPDAESIEDVHLTPQVMARIPIHVYADARGSLPRGTLPPEFAPGDVAPRLSAANRTTRLAAVALAWGVFEHFYPYFDVVETDWDSALTSGLRKAAIDPDERAFKVTLERLVAALHDGHGSVQLKSQAMRPLLPLRLGWAGNDLVVIGTCGDATGAASIGDAVLSIDGTTVSEWMSRAKERISAATAGWLRTIAAGWIVRELPSDKAVAVELRKPDGTEYSVHLTSTTECSPTEGTRPRPANGEEIAPGIRYFDLNGTETPALTAVLDQLATAKGIVFDLRGYPGSAARDLMGHLTDTPLQSAKWIVPEITRPDREMVVWQEIGRWLLQPTAPRLTTNVAFLTDGRAISYAESIMGIVEAYKLGAIVGATTAGTNGNVNPFEVPGGYVISWTGMRVLKHDGSQHHGVGIAPTLPVESTQQGIASGRDEVLEAAVALLSKAAVR
jgi:hypothetical protein